jgi:acryloyl-coenzyme A reductase
MKATLFDHHGGPEVLRYTDAPDPTSGPGEVILEVGAVTINHGPDTMVRSGAFGVDMPLPHISGSDPAGTVVDVGNGVDRAWIGERVAVEPIVACGRCDFCLSGRGENYCSRWQLIGVHRWGGRADLVAVPAANLVPLPEQVAFEEAASLGMAYLTAYHGLVTKAALGPQDTVLVLGASGGIGCACIQIAQHVGARVLAVTSDDVRKQARLREIGADVVLSHTDPAWGEAVRDATHDAGASVVCDNVGPATWPTSLRLIARGGRFVCSGGTTGYGMSVDAMALYRNHVTAYFYMCGPRSDLFALVGLVGDGRLAPVIDSRFALSEAVAAETRLTDRQQVGKIVLVPDAVLAAAQTVR